MLPVAIKRYSAVLVLGVSVGALLAADPRYISPTKNAPATKNSAPTKAEFDRKIADSKRKIEQGKRELKASQQRLSPQTSSNLATARSGAANSSAPKFDPKSALPPDECFLAFVAAAKKAGTMDQVLPYLSQREQEILKTRQARFDPAQAVKNRETLRKQNPKLSDDSLTHLSSAPYVNALKRHKDVASSVIRVMGVKIDGDKATVTVSTNSGATINGERYDYGTADVKMIGEGRTWKVAGFDSSILVYKQAP